MGAATAERQRVQIEFSADAFDRLKGIKEIAQVRSHSDVIRKALQIYDWFLRQQKDGWRIQLVKADTVKEVEMFL